MTSNCGVKVYYCDFVSCRASCTPEGESSGDASHSVITCSICIVLVCPTQGQIMFITAYVGFILLMKNNSAKPWEIFVQSDPHPRPKRVTYSCTVYPKPQFSEGMGFITAWMWGSVKKIWGFQVMVCSNKDLHSNRCKKYIKAKVDLESSCHFYPMMWHLFSSISLKYRMDKCIRKEPSQKCLLQLLSLHSTSLCLWNLSSTFETIFFFFFFDF